jgi:hypothetical protein
MTAIFSLPVTSSNTKPNYKTTISLINGELLKKLRLLLTLYKMTSEPFGIFIDHFKQPIKEYMSVMPVTKHPQAVKLWVAVPYPLFIGVMIQDRPAGKK